jgi:hypothetical protein
MAVPENVRVRVLAKSLEEGTMATVLVDWYFSASAGSTRCDGHKDGSMCKVDEWCTFAGDNDTSNELAVGNA